MFDSTDINRYDTFSEFLNASMKNSNITKQRLSELLDVHPAKVYRWSRGSNLPKKEAIVKMAHFFNINVNDLNRLVENQRKTKKKINSRKSDAYIPNDTKRIKTELMRLYKEKEEIENKLVNLLKKIIEKESYLKAMEELK